MEGSVKLNRLYLDNFSVRDINLRLGGRTLPWLNGMSMEFDKQNYTTPYICLINEGSRRNMQIPISYNDFMKGYAIYTFDCTPAHAQLKADGDETIETPRAEGSLELTCTFNVVPVESLYFVVLCYFPTTVNLDINRKFQITDNMATTAIHSANMQRSF